MHLGGEGESREAGAGVGVGGTEPSRVESSRRARIASAHASPTDESVLCTLLARSLAGLTWASENAGESRSAAKEYLRATSFTGVEIGEHPLCASELLFQVI